MNARIVPLGFRDENPVGRCSLAAASLALAAVPQRDVLSARRLGSACGPWSLRQVKNPKSSKMMTS